MKKLKYNKGQKDLDICFAINNNIYYFECKTNLNLDSEKSKSTDDKIERINEYLSKNNQKTVITSNLLTCWWEKESGLSIKTKTPLLYMCDFFELLGIEISKEEYYMMMIDLGKAI